MIKDEYNTKSEYMNTVKNKLLNREDFNLKFSDAPMSNGLSGTMSPGWAEPTYDDFFTRLVETPALLNQSHIYPMTNVVHDLDTLLANIELQGQRDATSGVSTGLTDVETAPNLARKRLVAVPLQAKTVITDNFLEENIEKENFMDTYINILTENMGPAFERFGIFADKSRTPASNEGSAYGLTDGVLTQLKTINSDSNNPSNGYAKLVYNDNVLQGIIDAILRYVDQDGNIANATCVLPPQIYARAIAQIGIDKDTDYSDLILQDGVMTKILGVTLVQDNTLRDTRNGFNTDRFTDGELKGNGTTVDKLTYGFIGKPENIIFGLMRDFHSVNQWDIDALGYKVALLCKGDVKVLFDQDTLAIPFTRNNSA